MLNSLQGKQLKNLFISGTRILLQNEKEINNLNVFPVPDGDTGTNMSLTLQAAARVLENQEPATVEEVANTIAEYTLRGARGNSGVILSQLFRGFAMEMGGKRELFPADFAAALSTGVATAYGAVMRPVEGTILTVAREAAKAALKAVQKKQNFLALLKVICAAARTALEDTPRLLAVLREAGVVDAGGKGLLCIYEGYCQYLEQIWQGLGDELPVADAAEARDPAVTAQTVFNAGQEITFGYCTELIVKGSALSVLEIQKELAQLGDSLLVVGDTVLVKVHIHTDHPGKVLSLCGERGSLHEIKVDNMREQHRHLVTAGPPSGDPPAGGKSENITPAPAGNPGQIMDNQSLVDRVAIIAVASGPGLEKIFSSLGAEKVIAGGQTMNTSTEDFLQAIESCNARKIIILPNNKNIILAARQTAALAEGREIRVVPTSSIPQGLSVLVHFNHRETSLDKLVRQAEEAARAVKSGKVTGAVRDASVNGYNICEGDWLGLWDDDLAVVGNDKHDVLLALLEKMLDDGSSLITVYHGEGVTEEETAVLEQKLRALYPTRELELYEGGQPLYPFLVSVE